MTRYERLREREIELIRQIEQLRREYQDAAFPLSKELMELREHRDGYSVELPDGRVYRYTGPRAPYRLPEEHEASE